MIELEELRQYLPKYLSPESEDCFFEELKSFPSNIDTRIYTILLADSSVIFQGDGIRNLLVVNLPDATVRDAPAMVLSNTCDISPKNNRPFPSAICYAPIFNLDKYADSLKRNGIKKDEALADHLASIRQQRLTQIFYLPKGAQLENESLVFLDRVNSCQSTYIEPSSIPARRLFTLSNYGAWLFLFKLSIHFTRFADRVDRNASPSPQTY